MAKLRPTPIMTSVTRTSLDRRDSFGKDSPNFFMAVVNIVDPLDIDIDQGQVFNSL